MSAAELITIIFFILVIAYWLNAIRAKEIACHQGKKYCSEHGLMFLDDTVVLSRAWPWKNRNGELCIYRKYQFEFCSSVITERRYKGEIELLGKYLMKITVQPYPVNDES